MTSAEIRQAFLDFFQSKGHLIVPSAPIVVKNDPTLMFTNAGMNQFKDYFLGNKPAPATRIADTQKCLRVSGKHNDLEEVGVDTYHHTMFEMLGNWSFGDYFKNEAIEWSWELLTKIYKIDTGRLYATVFEGDSKEGIPPSKIALEKWKTLLPDPETQIVFGNKKDNFWEMGDTGPCGPCSEIHVDLRSDEERKVTPGHLLVNKDHPQVIEIWNNVFIQFNRKKDGSLEPLPATHVDTGMGLERLVRVLQGKRSNYDTDIFSGTIEATEQISGKKYDGSDTKEAVAFRVIADHIRAISFTIADGQLPSNTGAGYVIRRILRRAVRYYYSYLDHKQPLLTKLVPVLAKQFEHVFPELQQQVDFVSKVVKEEEDAFLRTLDKGLKRMDDIIKTATNKTIAGKDAFELYDTFGFPVDLTRLIASENSLSVDEAGFESEMKQQKDRSRAATTIDAGDWIELKAGRNAFVGYDSLETKTSVLKYRKVTAKGKDGYQLVLASTPFYAESGGQVGDHGVLEFAGGRIEVIDTKKDNDLIIHFTNEIPADISGDLVAKVDPVKRKHTALHHSATHLLHAALRSILGTHVAQKGSLVNEEHLRFDFSHFARVTEEETRKIEQLVNEKIRENIPVFIKEMPKDEAMKLGAMALFGEKYGDVVRVVVMDENYSVELCGGTHVGHTGELGIFKISAESAVAAGVRRIEALCGSAAEQYLNEQMDLVSSVKEALKNPKDLRKAIESLQEENNELKKHLESMEARHLVTVRQQILEKDEIIEGVNFVGAIVEVSGVDALKKLCFDLKNSLRDHVAVLCVNVGGKPYVAIGISDTVVAAKGMDAGKLIKELVAPLIKGGGGGQKTMATAGGQDASRLKEVIEEVKRKLRG
ncbi:MAG: alanine--tRNA ligase [Chitinophagaceae bacterium]|nr:alanine--tRNA ligase [Chitinophagaceae bacterium]